MRRSEAIGGLGGQTNFVYYAAQFKLLQYYTLSLAFNIPNPPIVPRSLHDWHHAHTHSSVC